MALLNRQFTYKGRIKVSSADLALANSGRKTCTIRLGTLNVDGEFMDLSDGRDSLKVVIISIGTCKYRELTHQHAQWEGFCTVEELREDLAKYYRDVEPDQPITIIRFERVVV